jgi:hypothetical protein
LATRVAKCDGIDETLPNFIERKHPRKGEKMKQGARNQSPGKPTGQQRRATRRKLIPGYTFSCLGANTRP